MPEKLARVPPAWAKLHTQSQRALVRAEAKALGTMRASAKAVHSHVVAQLATAPNHIHAIGAVRSARSHIARAVSNSVFQARSNARDAAQVRLAAELEQLHKELHRLGIERPDLIVQRSDGAEDSAIAVMLGESYGSAWAAAMLVVILRWERQDKASRGSLPGQARVVLEQIDFRIRRIAATETARAFNNEHDEGVGYVAAQHKGSRWIAGLFKRWDAMFDRRVCATCRGHDGELALVGTSFTHDDRPAEVHAICRCLDSLVFLPLRVRAAEDTEGHYTQDEAAE